MVVLEFALGWVSLRLRGMRWADVGCKRPEFWGRAVAMGVAAGAAIESLELFVTQPWLVRITGKISRY
jgi:hypothetical protein